MFLNQCGLQAYCIESTNRGDSVFSSLAKQKQIQFKRMEQVTLEPYDKDHAYIMGAFRTLKVKFLFILYDDRPYLCYCSQPVDMYNYNG